MGGNLKDKSNVLDNEKARELMKAKKNAEYLAMLDKSMAEAEAGRFIIKDITEIAKEE